MWINSSKTPSILTFCHMLDNEFDRFSISNSSQLMSVFVSFPSGQCGACTSFTVPLPLLAWLYVVMTNYTGDTLSVP